MTTSYVVAVGVAGINRHPDPGSELVTQALMNRSVIAGKTSGEWTRVTLSDYEGWIRTDELGEPVAQAFCKVGEYCCTPLHLVAVITEPSASLYTEVQGDDMPGKVYLSTVLPLLDTSLPERVQVALPEERTAWLSRKSVAIRLQETPYPRTPLSLITTYARAFLGVPYLWGGTSFEGMDCSGLVQLCYSMGGYILPRDGDQQHDFLACTIERGNMQEGDLIFFGRQKITHVALALNDHEYIHSEGQNYNRVTINSFDAADSHYDERLDKMVWDIRRVVK